MPLECVVTFISFRTFKSVLVLHSDLMWGGVDDLDRNHVAARGLGGYNLVASSASLKYVSHWGEHIPLVCPNLFLWSWEGGIFPWQGDRAERGTISNNLFFSVWVSVTVISSPFFSPSSHPTQDFHLC